MLDKLGGAFICVPYPCYTVHICCVHESLALKMSCATIFMLCKVRSVQFGLKGIPYLNTYDDRTIRYPDPLIKANDTIKIDLETNKIMDFIKFDVGNVVMVTGGRNTGRVGVIKNREKHKGSFETIHVLLGAFLLCLVFSYLLYRKT
ncbi:40S ribosomal protein S4 [Zea mays]|uniref:40S ribosomal protein S4 n=1 Tax=Zea mays TaxID=4577 RepID=A0A3L6FQL2_MAIZE|nr:40S ribosomal protein S4 [Zea mays]